MKDPEIEAREEELVEALRIEQEENQRYER